MEARHADNQKLTKVLTSIHPLYPITGIFHEYKSWQGFHCLRYGWLLYCPGFLRLHKPRHCCISFFCQLDIAIKSLCIFVAVGCDGVIHIGKLRKRTNNLVYSLKSHHWVRGFRLLRLHHKDSLRKRVVLERYPQSSDIKNIIGSGF